jgi:uracil-DNA glycosylase
MQSPDTRNILLPEDWKSLLAEEFQKPYFRLLKKHLLSEKEKGKTLYPPGRLIFNAFHLCPLESTQVIILGQDPYHGPGQAMGLSFSVPKDQKVPPSLKNIYKKIQQDLNLTLPNHGDLSGWAKQGVLLLNAALTVEAGMPGSHQKIGWEHFTNAVLERLSLHKEGLVFMLWGNFARSKKPWIDANKHLVLESAHPSPLAGKAFFQNDHFLQCQKYLESKGKSKINWEHLP